MEENGKTSNAVNLWRETLVQSKWRSQAALTSAGVAAALDQSSEYRENILPALLFMFCSTKKVPFLIGQEYFTREALWALYFITLSTLIREQ